MQTATISLFLGGDRGQIIQKYDVTPAEVTVLRAIHGDEAVQEIKINTKSKDVRRTSRQELERLNDIYGRATDGEQNNVLRTLYPGAGAQTPNTFEELGLPELFYAANRSTVDYFPELENEDAEGGDDGDFDEGGLTEEELAAEQAAEAAAKEASDKEATKEDAKKAAAQKSAKAKAKATPAVDEGAKNADNGDAEDNDGIGDILD